MPCSQTPCWCGPDPAVPGQCLSCLGRAQPRGDFVPSTALDAVRIQDRDEFAGKMNLAQGFLFSCIELPAIWLGALQSLPPLSPSGEAMFFFFRCVCYVSQNVWPVHLKYLPPSAAANTGAVSGSPGAKPSPAQPFVQDRGVLSSCFAGDVAGHRKHRPLKCNRSRQGSDKHRAFRNMSVA